MNGNDESPEGTKKIDRKEPIDLPPLSSSPSNPSRVGEGEPVQPAPVKPQAPPVTEIRAKVDLTKKPTEMSEPINLLDDDEFFKRQMGATEGDLKADEEEKKKTEALKDKLGSSSTPPSSSPSKSPKSSSPEKRLKQAEKWVKAIDIARMWGLKAWSGQADNTGLLVSDGDKETLAEALADVMEEYDFDPAPLLTLAITATAVFGTSFSNASESRKKIREFRKTEEYKKAEAERLAKKEKPDLDPFTGKHNKRRGGQTKS